MGIGSIIGGVASAVIGAASANKASKAQSNAAANDLALQTRIYEENVERFQPFYETGLEYAGVRNYLDGVGDMPDGYEGFQQTPGYQFAVDQGTAAIDSGAAARGGLYSGKTMQDLQTYGQGMANQEFNNYYNRIAGGASQGQAAAGQQAQAGANYAAGGSNALSNMGNAQAAGAIGVGNAIQGGISNVTGLMNYQNSLNGGSANALSTPWGLPGSGGKIMASAQEVIQGLMTRGLPRHVAVGIAGNMAVESDGFQTDVNEYEPVVPGSRGGYGLNQWTGPRRRQFEQFAAQNSASPSDLDAQLDFTVWELQNTERGAGQALSQAQTPAEAARIYSEKFLRPGVPHLDRRVAAAEALAGGPQSSTGFYAGQGSRQSQNSLASTSEEDGPKMVNMLQDPKDFMTSRPNQLARSSGFGANTNPFLNYLKGA